MRFLELTIAAFVVVGSLVFGRPQGTLSDLSQLQSLDNSSDNQFCATG